ncbi:hypothetical protein M8818_005265 [Zalaria obscura]|uniref:Uncharacterized protein n=1 Tax=Zalaria obscura TaxID=2024903 RepID=A0ACC3S9V6_9PEZI
MGLLHKLEEKVVHHEDNKHHQQGGPHGQQGFGQQGYGGLPQQGPPQNNFQGGPGMQQQGGMGGGFGGHQQGGGMGGGFGGQQQGGGFGGHQGGGMGGHHGGGGGFGGEQGGFGGPGGGMGGGMGGGPGGQGGFGGPGGGMGGGPGGHQGGGFGGGRGGGGMGGGPGGGRGGHGGCLVVSTYHAAKVKAVPRAKNETRVRGMTSTSERSKTSFPEGRVCDGETVDATAESSRVLLGPLLTTCTQPTTCAFNCYDGSLVFQGQECSSSGTQYVLADATSCWPDATVTKPPEPPFGGWGFYSPGLVCPSGFTAACTNVFLEDGDVFTPMPGGKSFEFEFSLTQGETAVGCCPSRCIERTPSPTPTSPSATVTQDANTTPTSSPSGSLSTGAKTAIGIIVPVVAILAAIAAIWYLRKRKSTAHGPVYELPEIGTAEGRGNGKTLVPQEVSGNPIHELHVQPPELEGSGFHIRQAAKLGVS